MKKYIDFLLIFLLIFFTFQFFTNKKNPETSTTGVVFETRDTKYTIPASVFLDIQNNTSEKMSFDWCDAISLTHKWESVSVPPEYCGDINLAPWEKATIDFSYLYTIFEDPGDYAFEFQYDEKKYFSQIEVKNRGTLGKIFVEIFYAPIFNLMAYLLERFSYSLGWAIISLTILIRIVLLYPQHKMMVSQRKLQKIQPKIKAIQEKYKWDSQKVWVELMALYKKEKVNPFGSCGFLIIQMPILLVMYNIILNIKSPTNAFYLYPFLLDFHVSDISYDFFGIDLLSAGGITGLILAVSIAIIQYIQIKLSLNNNTQNTSQESKKWVVLEKKKWENDYTNFMPDPEMMNKFMLYGIPVMVWVFTFTLYAGVWLYWGVSTIFTIFQQLFVNKIIKK